MESELFKNGMKDVKITSYKYSNKFLKGIRSIKVLLTLVSVMDVILS